VDVYLRRCVNITQYIMKVVVQMWMDGMGSIGGMGLAGVAHPTNIEDSLVLSTRLGLPLPTSHRRTRIEHATRSCHPSRPYIHTPGSVLQAGSLL
jgi:hypothetical protein